MSTAVDLAPPTVDRLAVREMLVRQVRWEADGVVSVELAPADGTPVPAWEPGAHLDLVLPSGTVRQYSLCGDPADRSRYTVAVLREERGRGGSREIHDTALVGRTIGVRGPRNHFPLREAGACLLIAGGIGITPLLAMARQLQQRGADWRLVYAGRSRRTMAFLDLLAEYGEAVRVVPEDEEGRLDLAALMASAVPGTEIWCCGPTGLLEAVENAARERDIPVHTERFTASGQTPPAADAPGGETFEVELRRSGRTVEVTPDRSVLDAVREHVPDVVSSCEEGFCGACETPVLEGIPDHRDEVLSDGERAENNTMMICVSRACSKRLVLDL
ncbi:PDR/VanB family oxidoreductase [Streptomyces sp. NPDC048106]|uniref:PDR/VanB family oxidoreductase n=1 Tax=Streptomyces sp. NPDC048106 TaxID=3155750 RepID=UPI00345586FD